ncbi:hypothetical protein ACOSQ3_027040 [Xanthoceras sorbifolium]
MAKKLSMTKLQRGFHAFLYWNFLTKSGIKILCYPRQCRHSQFTSKENLKIQVLNSLILSLIRGSIPYTVNFFVTAIQTSSPAFPSLLRLRRFPSPSVADISPHSRSVSLASLSGRRSDFVAVAGLHLFRAPFPSPPSLEMEERSKWKNRWQSQLSELKRRSLYKDVRGNMSWGAQMRRQREDLSEEL